MQTTKTYLELLHERGKKGLPLERVYRQLFNRDLYLTAYGKIYRNAGAMTHGVTGETPDGMSLEFLDALIEAMRYERFQVLPVRRVSIPKKNGKKRPLGIPDWSQKLVQEVVRMILNAYYEPQFSDHSHGFRPDRGCHTALREIYRTWHGTSWFIEGDISACFDKLDHEVLLSILREHIHDERFVNLMQKLLEAGYMEEWTYNETLSGTPQGGIVSPILANIYLDRLDKFVENTLIPQYTRGERRKENPEYHSLRMKAARLWKHGKTEEAKRMKEQATKLPSIDVNDPDYRRLRYVRYADDFLFGFNGPKEEAEEIKQQLETFLREELKLELSQAKTLITHARNEAARFLGYEVKTTVADIKKTPLSVYNKRGKRRGVNGQIALYIPEEVRRKACDGYRKEGKAIHQAGMLGLSDYEIVMTYQLRFRGLANYYQMAQNMSALSELKWTMETSLTKTLAHKHQMSVKQVYRKYGTTQQVDGKPYKGLEVAIPREGKEPLVAKWGGIPLKRNMEATLDDQPPRLYAGRSELEKRLLAQFCELCGNTEQLEVHHLRAMKDLHKHAGKEKPLWMRRMIERKRKTLIVCRICHEDIHAGRPLRRQPISLEDVKALQKEGTNAVLGSRVH
jgi:group II intron reverse transcriptase/maturase